MFDPSKCTTSCAGCGKTIEAWVDFCDKCEEEMDEENED